MTLPTSLVMMALGTFRFGVNSSSYQTLKRVASYRWSSSPRIGTAPAEQFTGPGSETITMEGVILPTFSGGFAQIEAMRLVARLGNPMMLVDGLGFIFYRWVITEISETKSFFLSDGAPQRIEFSLKMRSYGEDRPWRII